MGFRNQAGTLGSQFVFFSANFRILATKKSVFLGEFSQSWQQKRSGGANNTKDDSFFFSPSMTPNRQIMGKKVSEFAIFGQ
jgi:hypothetical protein